MVNLFKALQELVVGGWLMLYRGVIFDGSVKFVKEIVFYEELFTLQNVLKLTCEFI